MDYTGYGDAPNDDLSLRQAWANMLRGLSNKQSWQELGQGIQNTAQVLPNVAESLARGGAAQEVVDIVKDRVVQQAEQRAHRR